MVKFLEKYGFWISLVVCILIYLTLAFKNPFGDNSLISNLEPYPDTLLYSIPAWNWVRGNGWNLGVGEKIIKISVPNTYGYLLVPLMWIFGDIRSFYFTNLILCISGLVFFMLALKNFFGVKKWYLIGFLGFLLTTNFYFFNQPQLVMAENVNYFLVGMLLYILSLKFEWKQIWLMLGLLIFTLILKSTNIVLAGGMILSFFLKIFVEKKISWRRLLILFGVIAVISLPVVIPRFLSLNLSAFGFKFFPNNFKFYYSCLTGSECRNLWYWQRLVSWDVVFFGVLGLLTMLINRKRRVLLLELILPIMAVVMAMSLFVDTEGRHIEILLPIILTIGAFGLDKGLSKSKWPVLMIIFLLGLNLLLTGYQPGVKEVKVVSLKKQIGLNFRHREDPWNYLCLRMVDDFMKDKPGDVFGSFLPMYFFDAYGVKINYLPLSAYQDFMTRGLDKYFPLPLKDIYQKRLEEKKEIYLTDYYASNGREYWRYEWNQIVGLGKLEKVYQSPLDNCNIYRLVESRKL